MVLTHIFMNYIDPFNILMRHVVLARFFRSDLAPEEMLFIQDNIKKHRKIYWWTTIFLVPMSLGVFDLDESVRIGLLTTMISPVLLLGSAWFGVSFGGVPAKLVEVAMSVTFWMYLSFKISFVMMYILLLSVTSVMLWPVWTLIMVGTFFACEMYDTADGFKTGLDEAQLRHSRAALCYYKQQGISPEDVD